MKRSVLFFCLTLLSVLPPRPAAAEVIGSVDTVFKLLGPDDKIVIEAFDDPQVEGVACHLSRAKKGGISGGLGVAEDLSDAAIACRQVGPIRFKEKIEDGQQVFSKNTSLLFKKIQVVRFLDKKRNVLIYLVYSDRLIDGSPKNSISSVPIGAWSDAPRPTP
ncbi:MAG: CreA family protein [Magnetococcales bacterium]|nr:CreA family protein [Magnetococcales bacterium]